MAAWPHRLFNPLIGTGNYSATSNNMKLVHWVYPYPTRTRGSGRIWAGVSQVGTLTSVNRWAVTFGTARRGLGGAAARPGFSSLYQM